MTCAVLWDKEMREDKYGVLIRNLIQIGIGTTVVVNGMLVRCGWHVVVLVVVPP